MGRQSKYRITTLMMFACIVSSLSGCYSLRKNAVPCCNVKNRTCCEPDFEQDFNYLTLRQTKPDQYVLDDGDVLGIYIQGITGDSETPPPVYFPDNDTLQPALGYPVPIRDDGYISLPLIPPVRLAGLTMAQAEQKIRDAYTKERKILREDNEKIIVTLMRRRTYNILVIREDIVDDRHFTYRKDSLIIDQGQQAQTFSIELPAYENDILHALSETGGMPGENAENQIVVMRGGGTAPDDGNGIQQDDGVLHAIVSDYPEYASDGMNGNVLRIPVRGGEPLELTQADITLNDGDVIYIPGREDEVFYTGGLLEGGRFPLPRDYEIDVLEAISMAGGSVSSAAGSSGEGLRGGTLMPATRVTVLRKEGCNQCTIDVDLRYALTDASQRVIVRPGDMIILEYRANELAINTALSLLQFGGISRLLD